MSEGHPVDGTELETRMINGLEFTKKFMMANGLLSEFYMRHFEENLDLKFEKSSSAKGPFFTATLYIKEFEGSLAFTTSATGHTKKTAARTACWKAVEILTERGVDLNKKKEENQEEGGEEPLPSESNNCAFYAENTIVSLPDLTLNEWCMKYYEEGPKYEIAEENSDPSSPKFLGRVTLPCREGDSQHFGYGIGHTPAEAKDKAAQDIVSFLWNQEGNNHSDSPPPEFIDFDALYASNPPHQAGKKRKRRSQQTRRAKRKKRYSKSDRHKTREKREKMNGRQEVGFKEIPDGVGKEAKGILMRLSGEVPFDVSYSTLKMEEGDDKVFIQEVDISLPSGRNLSATGASNWSQREAALRAHYFAWNKMCLSNELPIDNRFLSCAPLLHFSATAQPSEPVTISSREFLDLAEAYGPLTEHKRDKTPPPSLHLYSSFCQLHFNYTPEFYFQSGGPPHNCHFNCGTRLPIQIEDEKGKPQDIWVFTSTMTKKAAIEETSAKGAMKLYELGVLPLPTRKRKRAKDEEKEGSDEEKKG